MNAVSRKPGRPPALAGAKLEVVLHIRATVEQQTKLELLGGGSWVRKSIDKAKVKINTHSQ